MSFDRPRSWVVWALWHCVATLVIIAIPSQLYLGEALWTLPKPELMFVVILGCSYVASVVVLTVWLLIRSRVELGEVVLIVLALFGAGYLVILISDAYVSRALLPLTLIVALASVAGSLLLTLKLQWVVIVVFFALTVTLQSLQSRPQEFLESLFASPPERQRAQKIINSTLYFLKATYYDNYFTVVDPSSGRFVSPRNGGGISTFQDGYLLLTGAGKLHYFSVADDGELFTKTLAHDLPMNYDDFLAAGVTGSIDRRVFRATDNLVRERGRRFTIYAGHHYWNIDQRCSVLRISLLEGDSDDLIAGKLQATWRTVYETKPCLPLKEGVRGRPFAGDESGGRMAFVDDGTLLFTVGDHQFDGYNSKRRLAQEDNVDYGKTLLVNVRTGESRVFTSGHRNPQGLYVAPDGTIWSTEHGPEGGDELNVLRSGRNYGWPLVTYGVEYGQHAWPLNANPGEHRGYKRPVFSWLPSIAISNLIGVEGERFKLWQGDLLIASFKNSLSRARVREGRVVYLEHIQLRKRSGRLRNIIEDRNGRIVFWLDSGSLIFLEPLVGQQTKEESALSELERGQLLFSACSGCHNVKDGSTHGIGPDLAKIVGRRIGTAPGYGYSEALKGQSGYWTEPELDRFLAAPQQFAAGSTMAFPGVTDAEARRVLIQYLRGL